MVTGRQREDVELCEYLVMSKNLIWLIFNAFLRCGKSMSLSKVSNCFLCK
jgi:hypothetical protein